MRSDAAHIHQLHVVSNTHWDREFRWSFEKTRRKLLTMLDVTLDILVDDPHYHSFTMDGHALMIDDYLEMRPERRPLVEELVRAGRLILGPYYTLAEEFSIGAEALVRNLLWGRKTVEHYGGQPGTVAYTPASWGQTGQLPQILADFGLTRMMFYRGISHHEADAEWIWAAPDGTQMLASRFALYARYNWYYQVHRAVTTGRVFAKDYVWGERDEVPFRFADGLAGDDLSFELLAPALQYDPSRLRPAIEAMVAAEGPHFTTPVFLAMHGHDISVAHPLESQIIRDAQMAFAGTYTIEHTDLEGYWAELERHLDRDALPVLTGERRSYLKEGKWTYLFPATISARTYLKQQDFAATSRLTGLAEPLAALATVLGAPFPARYLARAWQALLSNHTHDANGGCAADNVCQDMAYRYRQASDIADIVTGDAMAFIAKGIAPADGPADAMQLIVFNALPIVRDAVIAVDVEVPTTAGAPSVSLTSGQDAEVARQPISVEKSGSFVDSIWDVPTIVDSTRHKFHAHLRALPALGYRVYHVTPNAHALRAHGTLLTAPNAMENAHLRVVVNGNGTIDLTQKTTGKTYCGLNYLIDSGECGNAWQHVAPTFDRVYTSQGVCARLAVIESGPLVSAIAVDYTFAVPVDYADGLRRSDTMIDLPVLVVYRLEKDNPLVGVTVTVDNRAQDHWLRAAFPTALSTHDTWADSHFDVVARPIPLPDSTGWVEAAGGTQPLRTFVAMTDDIDGFAVLPKGLFEYEAFEDTPRTLALTLLRACRIKLAVSEEKKTELPDPGVQCPGIQTFEYALAPHAGTWQTALIPALAQRYLTPVRAAMTGRGQGTLAHEASLFTLDNPHLQITCVKGAEDGQGMIIRLFNPSPDAQTATLRFGVPLTRALRTRMDETDQDALPVDGQMVSVAVGAKKIMTLRVFCGAAGVG
jgi:mannosylglycerate hydrolase